MYVGAIVSIWHWYKYAGAQLGEKFGGCNVGIIIGDVDIIIGYKIDIIDSHNVTIVCFWWCHNYYCDNLVILVICICVVVVLTNQ